MSDSSGSVVISLMNASDAPTAYVSQQNTMTLEMTNQTGALIKVEPGTPQNPPPDGGSFGVGNGRGTCGSGDGSAGGLG